MNLLIEDKGTVRTITLNRSEKRNALDTALTRDLLEALREADAEAGMHCVVLTGAGPGFCAGADLSEFKGLKDPKAAKTRAELTMQLHLVFSKMDTPVVTAINGAAMGGGAGLAIAGDIAVMAESAKIGYPETKHGIVAAIVMANLVRQIGHKAAFELVALGEPIGARRAPSSRSSRATAPITSLATARRNRSPSTCAPTMAASSSASSPRKPTCWSRTSRSARSGATDSTLLPCRP